MRLAVDSSQNALAQQIDVRPFIHLTLDEAYSVGQFMNQKTMTLE